MDIEIVNAEINKANNYLKEFLWMDFDFSYIGGDSIKIYGCIDQSWREEYIEIIFYFPQLISSTFTWTMNEKKPFIRLIDGNEVYKKCSLMTEQYYHVFALNDEDSEEDRIFITAKGIRCNILKEKTKGEI